MAGVWKRDGTVTVTSGSKRVIGVGTTFADPKNGVAKGHIFTQISGSAVDLYEVDYVVSNTELYLVQAFRGTTASGAAYAIITTFSDSIPEFSRKLTATLASYQEQSDVLQLLYTSDAAEITVTAPDGTTHKLIPWKRVTSEGEGQAARAKVEADRAKTEADKAAQAVIDSAVPFPDVWIPFNDSLRMFAGYGREVKVGDDVVARMVNYERSTIATYTDKSGVLRTAAINEPRFDALGLIMGPRSTNLLPYSDDANKFIHVNCSADSSGVVTGLSPGGTQTRIEYRGVVPVGSTGYTCSVEYDPSQGLGVIQVRLGGSEAAFPVASTDIVIDDTNKKVVRKVMPDGWVRVSVTSKVAAGEDLVRINFAPHGSGNSVDVTSGLKAKVRRMQLEPLPFATSYIPTNGAAVTRAADKCWVQYENNLTPNARSSFTISAVVDAMSVSGIPASLIDALDITPHVGLFINANGSYDSRTFDFEMGTPNMIHPQGSIVRVGLSYDGKTGLVRIFSGGVIRSASAVVSDKIRSGGSIGFMCRAGTTARNAHGHIRDVRIWHHALSDAQIKGLK